MDLEPGERIEFSRPAELPGAEVLLAEHSSRRWRWFHETYSICTVMSGHGSIEWRYRGEMHAAEAGHVQLYEPGEVHRNRNILANAAFRVLFIPAPVMQAAAAELDAHPVPHWKMAHTGDAELLGALTALHAALERSATALEIASRFAGCIRRLLGRAAERAAGPAGQAAPQRLRAVRDYIHAHAASAITLSELAAVSGFSRFHLARAFAAHFGEPPHAYQIHLRVHQARELMAAGERPAPAAAQAGFADQSHLSRHFKKLMHLSPAQYKRMVHAR